MKKQYIYPITEFQQIHSGVLCASPDIYPGGDGEDAPGGGI